MNDDIGTAPSSGPSLHASLDTSLWRIGKELIVSNLGVPAMPLCRLFVCVADPAQHRFAQTTAGELQCVEKTVVGRRGRHGRKSELMRRSSNASGRHESGRGRTELMRINYPHIICGSFTKRIAMRSANVPKTAKKPVNLSINSDLLAVARKLKINLSATMEAALVDAVTRKQRERWLEENQAAIEAYNERVNTDGVFSDGLREILMPQFAVYRNPNPATRTAIPLLLDVRSDLLEALVTRVVIPLYMPAAVEDAVIGTLTPRLELDGAPYIAVTPELAGVPENRWAPRWVTCHIPATTSSRRWIFFSPGVEAPSDIVQPVSFGCVRTSPDRCDN
ncbi:MAG: type II toxin-antitoxin system CcdA family antitoxin [Woeseiaceae bacterium]|nr:type II toxin-antitoxin system CcdA family antitoxin [Woeseiaceae bacterium]